MPSTNRDTLRREISILGTRGIPARHGGFETFVERLAPYLADRGWRVTVYCQAGGEDQSHEDNWQGVRRVHLPVHQSEALGTIVFDWKSTVHAAREGGLKLVLGYNTALFSALYRVRGRTNLINMDGIEWQREKWSFPERAWLYLNERFGCWLGNHLIADHPEIKTHLATRVAADKITVIPYGADAVTEADAGLIGQFGLEPDRYALVIARPEPENSILEIISAFSERRRGLTLAVLGQYQPANNSYHRRVLDAAGPEVKFLGAVYERERVNALRCHGRLYIHGHTVGGTNPSLVEALGAGMPVLAHDNRFNRWVAGEGARYFDSTVTCARHLDAILGNHAVLEAMRTASRARFAREFTWERILGAYERLLAAWA
jgi:glycosyltransferase involved in cell wall biosynthesis